MPMDVAGFPFWELHFDGDGRSTDPAGRARFLEELKAQAPTDLFIFSHGWNNDPPTARRLYRRFFEQVRRLLDQPPGPLRRQARIAAAGVVWPSILWPDEEEEEDGGGAASLGGAGERDLRQELAKLYPDPEQQRLLDELLDLLERQPRNEAALQEFGRKLAQLVEPPGEEVNEEEQIERMTDAAGEQWRTVYESLAHEEPAGEDEGGAAGIGDAFSGLWRGAKGALRVATYWKMKQRAGVVGRQGLGPLVGEAAAAVPGVRVHLLGHSFGARLVSYSLAGLPDAALQGPSPVKSLFLLQGAFSHFTFADALPHDRERKGELAGMARRVDGPLLTTFSLKDLAVGRAYPLASRLKGQDASTAAQIVSRWGAMGNDGAQAVQARTEPLGAAGTAYAFQPQQWLNLDGNEVIVTGGPPSGAHSDIVHPHTAWAALAAAGIA